MRREQIEEIQDHAGKMAEKIDAMRVVLNERYEKMSEKVQNSERGGRLLDQIEILDNWHDYLTDIAAEDLI